MVNFTPEQLIKLQNIATVPGYKEILTLLRDKEQEILEDLFESRSHQDDVRRLAAWREFRRIRLIFENDPEAAGNIVAGDLEVKREQMKAAVNTHPTWDLGAWDSFGNRERGQ